MDDPDVMGGDGPGDAGRGRRSDQRRSSRRHQAKRERDRQRQRDRAAKADRAALAAEVAAIDLDDLEIDLEAEPSFDRATAPAELGLMTTDGPRRPTKPPSRLGRGVMVTLLVVAAAAAGVGLRLLARDADALAANGHDGIVLPAGVDRQPVLLLMTSADDNVASPAENAVLLAYDRIDERATILLIPVSTVADIPGHGVLHLSRSLEFGGSALAAQSTDNLMGINVDGVARMTYPAWATLFGRAGEIPVEVQQRITVAVEDGGTQVQFLAGAQSLDGLRAAEYLSARIPGQPELSALPRTQDLLVGWLEILAQDPARYEDALGDGLPMIDTGMPRGEVVALFEALVAAVREDRLDVRVLPVRPIGSGAEDGYRVEPLRLEELVSDRFAGSVPESAREGRSLQVLNGNGLPGIGQSVAARLLPAGYRVVLTGNADDFNYDVTKIVIFNDSPEQIAIANEIRELLGVGQVEISITPQSVVDVTIVVGADFSAS